jgi:hypothetical protein
MLLYSYNLKNEFEFTPCIPSLILITVHSFKFKLKFRECIAMSVDGQTQNVILILHTTEVN